MTLERHTFDRDTLIVADAAHLCAVHYIATNRMRNIDAAIAGVRLYLTACDILGGDLNEVRFPYNGQTARVSISRRVAVDGEEFVESDWNKDEQMEYCSAIMDAMDKEVHEGRADGWQQGILAVIGVRVMMLGIDKSPDIHKLCIRHSKQNYVISISTPTPVEVPHEKEGTP